MELFAYFFALIVGFLLGTVFESGRKNKKPKEIDYDKLLDNIRAQQDKETN